MESINAVYTEEYCKALELAYGDSMMSEGGAEAIDLVFKDINLKGKKVLDFGSGLGGVAFYIAQEHEADVTGLEINPEMIKTASSRIPVHLKNQVRFVQSVGNNLPFPAENFDIICSVGVLVHLTKQQKLEVFKEFYRTLKTGGDLAIRDWLSPTDDVWGEHVKRLIESEHLPLYACASKTYINLLRDCDFSGVSFTDCSEIFTRFNGEVIERLNSPGIKQEFINCFGEETWKEHINGYENIALSHKRGELVDGLLKALKTEK